jgi:hypothetical protein
MAAELSTTRLSHLPEYWARLNTPLSAMVCIDTLKKLAGLIRRRMRPFIGNTALSIGMNRTQRAMSSTT